MAGKYEENAQYDMMIITMDDNVMQFQIGLLFTAQWNKVFPHNKRLPCGPMCLLC